jgi:hypothetical protein
VGVIREEITIMKTRTQMHPRFEASEQKFGRLPATYSGLGRYADALAPRNLLGYRVYPPEPLLGETEPTYMLTTRAGYNFSIMRRDLESLLDDAGLMRIQTNEPGEVSLYFNKRYSKHTKHSHTR